VETKAKIQRQVKGRLGSKALLNTWVAVLVLLAVWPAPGPAQPDTTYNHYIGNLHSHTSYSDGQGTPAIAFAYARDSARIDFMAVTDHHNGLVAWEYEDILAQADYFNEDGVFVAIGGQEWTGIGRSHATVFEADHIFTAPQDDFDSFYVELYESGCHAIFAHPEPENFDGYEYSAEGDVYINAVEVRTANEQALYAKMLNMGWRLGVDGSQDNHWWNWGERPMWTVVLAPALNRPDILDASRNHRTYSVLDRDIRMTFKAGGHWMGETFSTGENVSFAITVSDSEVVDKFDCVELYQNGNLLAWADFDTNCVTWTPEITPRSSESAYFIRAHQNDNHYCWSSPIWIEYTGSLPSTVALSLPKDEAATCRLRPELAWFPAELAESYTLEYSAAESFPVGDSTRTVTGIVDTSYTLAHMLGDGRRYYWRVTALNDTGSSIISGTRCFHTDVVVFAGGSEIRLTTDGELDMYPSICQAADRMWLVWTSRRSGRRQLYYMTSPDGETWTDAARLTASLGGDLEPAILEDADGRIWIAWHSNRSGDAEILYKTYDGMSWSGDDFITQHPRVDEGPSIAQASDSLVWVVWASDREEGNLEIYGKTFDGDSWSGAMRLTHNDSLDYHPRITRVDSGDLWMVWATERNGDAEIYLKTHDGMAWSEDIRLGFGGESPSITRTGEGEVWIAYSRDSEVFYRRYEDGDWSDESVLPTSPGGNRWSSITRDSLGSICVAFSSSRSANEDVYLQRTRCTVTSGVEDEPAADVVPEPLLLRNTPNPFSLETAFEFRLRSAGHVELTVYDVRGARVAKLVDGWKEAGLHRIKWDGANDGDVKVSCGVYFCTLKQNGSSVSRKLVYLK